MKQTRKVAWALLSMIGSLALGQAFAAPDEGSHDETEAARELTARMEVLRVNSDPAALVATIKDMRASGGLDVQTVKKIEKHMTEGKLLERLGLNAGRNHGAGSVLIRTMSVAGTDEVRDSLLRINGYLKSKNEESAGKGHYLILSYVVVEELGRAKNANDAVYEAIQSCGYRVKRVIAYSRLGTKRSANELKRMLVARNDCYGRAIIMHPSVNILRVLKELFLEAEKKRVQRDAFDALVRPEKLFARFRYGPPPLASYTDEQLKTLSAALTEISAKAELSEEEKALVVRRQEEISAIVSERELKGPLGAK